MSYFAIAQAQGSCPPSTSTPPPPSTPTPPATPPPPPPGTPTPPATPTPPPPGTPTTPPATPTPPPATPTPPAIPMPPPPGTGGNNGTCPINTLRLLVCADVLNLLNLGIGVPANEQCCPLLQGLIDLDAAICLCLALRANILGIILDLNLALTVLLNFCNQDPSGFICPA